MGYNLSIQSSVQNVAPNQTVVTEKKKGAGKKKGDPNKVPKQWVFHLKAPSALLIVCSCMEFRLD